MKRLAFAAGLLAIGFGAVTSAHADFAVVKFDNGSCRVWSDTASRPSDGRFLWFKRGDHARYRFATRDGAHRAVHLAAAQNRCNHIHWWWD